MRQIDVIWLAGLLEGEGCFNLREERNQPRVSIEMTDEDIIKRVAKLWTSNVSVRPGRCKACGRADCQMTGTVGIHKTSYQTTIYGDRARNMMRLVYAFMGNRRSAKIAEILGGLI